MGNQDDKIINRNACEGLPQVVCLPSQYGCTQRATVAIGLSMATYRGVLSALEAHLKVLVRLLQGVVCPSGD